MVANDLFIEMNNAVLDLQAAHLQSYDRPIRRLAGLLNHSELQALNESLTENVDLDHFLKDSAETQGGMAGSASLLWPDDMRKTLGLTLMLIRRFGESPEFMEDIGHLYFYSGSSIMAGVQGVIGQIIVPFARDYKNYILSRGDTELKIVRPLSNKIFIVHGHDEGAREAVARFIMQLGFEPIILHEQANRGRTVIEKVEAHGEVSFAIVLLTPDDEGNTKGGIPEPRARQNVLLELGYFLGRLGRENVCALKRGQVEIPSDFAGVVWEAMDSGNGWKQSLGRELQAAGHDIDWNKVMR